MSDDIQPPARLRDVLGAVGARIGVERPVQAGMLWARWAEIVGESVAEHAEPTSLKRGVLRVRADSPAWAAEIGYLSESIKERANALVGEPVVSAVRLWAAPRPLRRGARDGPEPVPRGPRGDWVTAGSSPRSEVRNSPSAHPLEALERARAAWMKRRSQHRDRDALRGPQSGENPW